MPTTITILNNHTNLIIHLRLTNLTTDLIITSTRTGIRTIKTRIIITTRTRRTRRRGWERARSIQEVKQVAR